MLNSIRRLGSCSRDVSRDIRRIATGGGLWLFFGHLLTVVGQFAFIKAIAVLGSPELLGFVGLLLAVTAALRMLIYGPLIQWAIRHYQEFLDSSATLMYTNVLRRVVFWSCVSIALILAILLLTATLTQTISSLVPKDYLWSIVGSLVFAVTVCLNDLLSSILSAAARARLASLFFTVAMWARIFCAVALHHAESLNILSLIVLLTCVQGLILVIQYNVVIQQKVLRTIPDTLPISEREIWKGVRAYSLPFVIWGIPAYVMSMGDRWVLASFVDPDTLGIYVAMALCTFGVSNTANTAFSRSILPTLFRVAGSTGNTTRKKESARILANMTIISAATNGMLVFVYYLAGDNILTFFTSSEYGKHSDNLWLLMLAAAIFAQGQFIVTQGLLVKDSRRYLLVKLVSGVIASVLLVALASLYQILGIIWALLISNSLHFLLVLAANYGANRDGGMKVESTQQQRSHRGFVGES